eukprot:comp21141_c0_seq1/m.28598 comp21141_c0_seq1/g.28598  ORF comp21141_c0_seq1/g.28598 comp21141_c0_seq1/m.28598 type:complete len:200 (-) comp21141_c0_seq1:61-660(-)
MSSEEESFDGKDDDVSLPKATVYKLIKEMMPKDIRCANDTRALILDCCKEFILLMASESNEVCAKDGKKTISAEHVIDALRNLGFEEYIESVKAVYEEHKDDKSKRVKINTKLEKSGIPQEELLAQQRALFAQARMRTHTFQTPPIQQPASGTLPAGNPPGLNALGAQPGQPFSFNPPVAAPAPAPVLRKNDDEEDYDA